MMAAVVVVVAAWWRGDGREGGNWCSFSQRLITHCVLWYILICIQIYFAPLPLLHRSRTFWRWGLCGGVGGVVGGAGGVVGGAGGVVGGDAGGQYPPLDDIYWNDKGF